MLKLVQFDRSPTTHKSQTALLWDEKQRKKNRKINARKKKGLQREKKKKQQIIGEAYPFGVATKKKSIK